jgi:hypothetical protein
MHRQTTIVLGLGMLLVVLVAAYLQTSPATAMQVGQPGVINNPDLIVPAVRILRFDNQVVRLDTATGEMSRFSGTVSGGGASGTWLKFAKPIVGATSQFLEFRSIAGGAFLIDQVTGQTWVLRRAPGAIGTWINVQQP